MAFVKLVCPLPRNSENLRDPARRPSVTLLGRSIVAVPTSSEKRAKREEHKENLEPARDAPATAAAATVARPLHHHRPSTAQHRIAVC